MDGHRFSVSVHLHGTLSANAQGSFALSGPAALVHVSAVASNDSDATLYFGDAGDTNGIKTAAAIGDSGVPTQWGPSNFDGALADAVSPYQFVGDDDVLHWLLDYDGASGTAAQNVTIVFTFVDGGPQS